MATFQGPPPPGYRFRPKDDELLAFYLTKKINAHYPLPSLYPHIFDFDVYAHHPSTIFQSSKSHRYGGDNDNNNDNDGDGEMHCYIFTNLKTKESIDNHNVCIKGKRKKGSSSGKRKCRTISNLGTWEQQFTKNVSLRGSLLGFKKYFKFVPSNIDDNNNNNKDGKYEYEYEWSMYEYTLLDHPDFALCRLTKKKMNKKNNNGSAIVIQLGNVGDDDGDNHKSACVDEWCWDNSELIGSPCLTNVADYDFLSGIDEFINDVDKGVYYQLFISEPGKQDYNNNDDDEHGISNSKRARVDESLDDGVDKEVYDELLSQLGQVQDYNNHHLTLVNDNDGYLQISSTKADQDWDDRELEDLLNQD